MAPSSPDRTELVPLVEQAADRIAPYIWNTPVEFSPALSQITGGKVYLKLESLQRTGSFKIRGAANFILSLPEGVARKGLVTASTGNHAAAFATMVDQLKLKGTTFLPGHASAEKMARLAQFKVQTVLVGSDCLEAEEAAIRFARDNDQTYLSPYNPPDIIAGQGTIGLELLKQAPEITHLFCPVGGGGLASGVGSVLKSWRNDIKIFGCQPVNSKVMYESIKAGRIVVIDSQPTLSDGTAGGVEAGAITFDHCRRLIDDFCLITEDEILNAIRLVAKEHQLIIEGSAALSVAGLIQRAPELKNARAVAILTGRRLSYENTKAIFAD